MPPEHDDTPRKGKKVRVPFRRNRSPRRRRKDWTQQSRDSEDQNVDSVRGEQVVPRGDLSRQRTVIVHDVPTGDALRSGTVVAVRGLFADVDDGQHIWSCTIRRILRTRSIDERNSLTVGDHVRFSMGTGRKGVAEEGAIESVEPRRGQLSRRAGRRTQIIVANVDQVIIVSSAARPDPKPHLIDRYIVSALAGAITPVICMNKIDLDTEDFAAGLLERYEKLGYSTLGTSAETGQGVDTLRDMLKGKESVIAGQSGVGKSSLLNAVQPGLELRTGDVIHKYDKGRHTTTTATLIRLDIGGYVVDTPGIRALDLSIVPRGELEAHFVDLARFVPDCKFPDCTHIHEANCAVKDAVERGDIHPERYDSYVRLFTEPA